MHAVDTSPLSCLMGTQFKPLHECISHSYTNNLMGIAPSSNAQKGVKHRIFICCTHRHASANVKLTKHATKKP